MMQAYLQGLNEQQKEAVTHMNGPLMIIAGAGSGKTKVLTSRIAHLMNSGVDSFNILALTFTNKAAQEMRERAKSLIGKPAKDLTICTFHALGVHILRQDGEVLGLKQNFSILDSDDVFGIIRDAGAGADTATARAWQWKISSWKNIGLNSETALAQAQTTRLHSSFGFASSG